MVTLAAAVLAAPATPRAPRDLDVGIPPGLPTSWTRSFPSQSPPRRPLFPETRAAASEVDRERSQSKSVKPSLDVRSSSSFFLVQILTWDLAAHLTWISSAKEGPLTGRSGLRPPAPRHGEPLYWVSLATMLRVFLHAGQVSRAATIAHLVEIGDATLSAAEQARAESALRYVCDAVEERVELDGNENLAHLTWEPETEREAMLARFVREEILGVEPYDPSRAFGDRVFLFSEEVFPILVEFAAPDSPLALRRNATVALGRYRTREAMNALVQIAVTTDDDVVLFRALAALGGARIGLDWGPIAQRLGETSDEVRRVALLGALANSDSKHALEVVAEVAKRAYGSRSSDLLEAALVAICALPPGAPGDELDDLLDDIRDTARMSPRSFEVAGKRIASDADFPDDPRTRGRVIEQLATIARARYAPGDDTREKHLLDLLAPSDEPPLGSIFPSVQLAFVEALGSVAYTSEAARDALVRIARLGQAPTAGHALVALPLEERARIALEHLSGKDSTLRLVSLHVLLNDMHKDSEKLARGLLEECARLPAGEGEPATRALYLEAVRALDLRERLAPKDLLPLMHHARAPRDAFAELPLELASMVDDAIVAASSRMNESAIRKLAEPLVEFVLRHEMNEALVTDEGRGALDFVTGYLKGVRAQQSSPGFITTVRESILAFLLGYTMPTEQSNTAQFSPPVLLVEEILLALGRTRTGQAAELILQVLDNPKSKHRAIACLALGMTGQSAAAERLAPFLLDDDPFTRFCAYEAIRHLVDYEEFVDWMYAPAIERYAAAERAWRWIVERKK